jgi:hypothetical protein
MKNDDIIPADRKDDVFILSPRGTVNLESPE